MIKNKLQRVVRSKALNDLMLSFRLLFHNYK
jgi:hypothetical protein